MLGYTRCPCESTIWLNMLVSIGLTWAKPEIYLNQLLTTEFERAQARITPPFSDLIKAYWIMLIIPQEVNVFPVPAGPLIKVKGSLRLQEFTIANYYFSVKLEMIFSLVKKLINCS